MRQVAAAHAVAEHFLAVVVEALFLRRLVDAVDGGAVRLQQPARHGLVGQEHELLDELVGGVVFHALDAQHAALPVEADFVFGEVEVQRAVGEAQLAHALRQGVRVVQHPLQRIPRRALDAGKSLLIAEAAPRVDDRWVKPGADDFAVAAQHELDALRQTVEARLERAQLVAQGLRQHGNDTVHEVGGVAAPARLGVQRAAGADVMGDIGDVDPQAPLAVLALHADGVVEVLGVIRVNGDDRMRAAVHAPRALLRRGLVVGPRAGDGACLGEHGLGEVQRQVVMPEHGEHVHTLLVGRAEDFDDLALGRHAARLPAEDLDDDLVPDARGAAHIARLGHINGGGQARIVRRDVEEFFPPVQRADKAAARTLQHAHHGAAHLAGRGAFAQALRLHIQAHQHAVAVDGGGGGVFRDADLRAARLVGLDKAAPAAGDLDDARHQVGLGGEDVAVPLRAHDAAFGQQAGERALQLLLLVRREAELLEQFGDVGGLVTGPREQLEDFRLHGRTLAQADRAAKADSCARRESLQGLRNWSSTPRPGRQIVMITRRSHPSKYRAAAPH